MEEEGKQGGKREKNILAALSDTFFRNIRKGVILTNKELRQVALKKNVVVTEEDLETFRQHWPHLQRFRDARTPRPIVFQTLIRGRYATAFADVGFLSGYKRENEGHIGFLLFVEAFSGQMAAIPIKKRDIPAFEEAFEKLIRLTSLNELHLVLCDRERSMFSKKFQIWLKQKHGIRLRYLHTRSKAWKAERGIAVVRRRLIACMETAGTRHWLSLLNPLLRHWNSQEIQDTGYRRRDITSKNLHHFLAQKYGAEDIGALFSVSTVNAQHIKNQRWLKRIFSFDTGDKVLVEARAAGEKDKFYKATSKGYYSKLQYIVKARYVATARDLSAIPGRLNFFFLQKSNKYFYLFFSIPAGKQ